MAYVQHVESLHLKVKSKGDVATHLYSVKNAVMLLVMGAANIKAGVDGQLPLD